MTDETKAPATAEELRNDAAHFRDCAAIMAVVPISHLAERFLRAADALTAEAKRIEATQ